MRAKGNTRHPCGRSAGWTEIRGLGKREMKSLFLSQRMAGSPSGLSEKDLNALVSFTVTFSCESAKEHFVSPLLLIFCCCFCLDLMKLKRVNVAKESKAGGGKKSDALISRFAAGFCFDVHPNDSNM